MPFSNFLSPLHSAAKSPMGVHATCDPNWQTYDDYFVRLLIEFEEDYRSGLFNELDLEIQQRPGIYQEVIFNINRLVQGKLNYDRPNLSAVPVASVSAKLTRRFKVKLEEVKNGLINSSIFSGIFHGYLAGFSQSVGQYMLTHINQKKFLTHQPAVKTVSSAQSEFLYLVANSTETYHLKANLYHEDGTETLAFDPGFSIAAEQYDVLIFPVGFEQLGLDSINPVVESWEIYIENNLSEKRTYQLDCQCTPLDRYYLIANSLGGFDTVRTTGELSVKDKSQGQRIEKIRSPFSQPSERVFQDIDSTIQESCDQHTGHLTQEENFWLKDLLLSEDAYRIGDYLPNLDGVGELIPIVIDRGSVPRYQDQEFLYGFSFSYQEAFQNRGI